MAVDTDGVITSTGINGAADIEEPTVRLSAPSELEFGSDLLLISTSAPETLPLTTSVSAPSPLLARWRTNSYRVVAGTAVDQTRSGCPSNRDAVSAGITKDQSPVTLPPFPMLSVPFPPARVELVASLKVM